MIELREKETGSLIGKISEDQLQFLIDQLEEESSEDVDYYINRDTLDVFEEEGIDKSLLEMLRRALGTRDEMEIKRARLPD